MKIRLAESSDIAAILTISNWAAENTPANFAIQPEALETWKKSFEETHCQFPWLVAFDPDTAGSVQAITGFAKASPHRARCAYAWSAEVSVYIDPKHHGRGVGTALYQTLIPMLKAQGFVTLIAGITIPNPASVRLHEAFGFKRIGTFSRVGWKFNTWHDVGYWQATLREGDEPPPAIQRVSEVWNSHPSTMAHRS